MPATKPAKRKFIDYTTDSEVFDLKEYFSRAVVKAELLNYSEGRTYLTYNNPLLFALIYFPDKLSEEVGNITFADFHLEVSKWAATSWIKELLDPIGPRDAFICPRNMGKSTWLIDILTMWAACHGHISFVALFADSATQAEQHLSNFRETVQSNELLRQDYPRVCGDATNLVSKFHAEIKEEDRKNFFRSNSGFTFTARGIDAGVLGLKVGNKRPDLLLLDDVIKGSGSQKVMQDRLNTVVTKIFPLRDSARVVITGTSFTPGDMLHQLKRAAQNPVEAAQWVTEERINSHYYSPYVKRNDGTIRSGWSAKWSKEYLDSIKDNRSFAIKFLNEPLPDDGNFWDKEHFIYGNLPGPGNHRILSIDPAVTTGAKSDFTALSVVKYSNADDKFEVMYSAAVKMQGTELRTKIQALVMQFDITQIIIETNAGGELWTNNMGVLHDIPGVKITPVHFNAGESKQFRAEWALMEYQRGNVLHSGEGFYDLEVQMMSFPAVPNDDLVDSVTAPIYIIRKNQKQNANKGPVRVSKHYARR